MSDYENSHITYKGERYVKVNLANKWLAELDKELSSTKEQLSDAREQLEAMAKLLQDTTACVKASEAEAIESLNKKLSKADRAKVACMEAYERIERENAKLRVKVFRSFNDEECWIWQGDDSDKLESLVCPVVIHPSDLMEIIDGSKASEAEAIRKALQDFWSILNGELVWAQKKIDEAREYDAEISIQLSMGEKQGILNAIGKLEQYASSIDKTSFLEKVKNCEHLPIEEKKHDDLLKSEEAKAFKSSIKWAAGRLRQRDPDSSKSDECAGYLLDCADQFFRLIEEGKDSE